ncbi:MAG: ABC transporter permease subunit [Actinomycetota bacterium]|jgi:ABC-2 type transport system permease protein|nr:ABC transporter permease subunit [Actinomycetota bacterium]
MSWTLFKGTMHQRRWHLFWFSASLVAFSWMMVWFWPQMGGADYAQLIETMPQEMIALFGDADISIASLGGFFQTEYLGLMWIVIVASAVIGYASKSVATEIGNGTMELLLSQPLSRSKFILTRMAGLFAYVLTISAATFVPIQIFGPGYDIDLSAETFWMLFGLGALFMLAIGSFAFMLSALSRDGGRPVAITSAMIAAMWIGAFLVQVSDFADALEPFNLLSYWEPGKIINEGALSTDAWWVYAGVATVSLVVAYVGFLRRDVT